MALATLVPLRQPRDWRAAARAVAEAAFARAPDHDRDGAAPLEDIAALRRHDLLTAPLDLPEREGGRVLADILRLVGWGSLPLGRLYEGHVNALALVRRFGAPAQRARWAGDAAAGRLFGVWNTEAAENPLLVRETAGGLVLEGGKTFASGAGFVERPLVTARTPDGRRLMLVLRLDPGERADLSGWRAHGMRASATGTMDLAGLAATDDDILGRDDDYHRQPGFSGGAWRFAAVHLGGIERVLDSVRAHLVAGGRSGDPHQLARVGQAALAAETARLWVEHAAVTAQEGARPSDEVVAYVNLARLAVERAGLDVLELAHRSIGLAGFLAPHPMERLTRDLATYLRQPAPDRALTEAAAHVLARPETSGDLWR